MEEAARCSLGPIALRAVIDGVEVQLEDLILRIAAIEVDRERRLSDFALDRGRWVRADEDLLDELLADRASTLGDVVMRVIGDGRPRDATDVDPIVFVERPIFDGDGGLLEERGYRVQRHDDPVIAVVADVVDQSAVAVEDQHVLVEPAGGEAVDRRKVADGFSREGWNRQQRKGEQDQREQDESAPPLGPALTLAEQPQPAVKQVAGATAARHQAAAGELGLVESSITKDDSGYVGNNVKTEISRRVDPSDGRMEHLATFAGCSDRARSGNYGRRKHGKSS